MKRKKESTEKKKELTEEDIEGAKQAALSYAKRNIEFQTWVDRVEIDDETEECVDAETVWSYDEEDWNEEIK